MARIHQLSRAVAALILCLVPEARGQARPGPAPAASDWRYVVHVRPDLSVLRAELCFDAGRFRRLELAAASGTEHLRRAELVAGERRQAIPTPAKSISLEGWRGPACLRYEVDLRALSGEPRAEAIRLDPATWLWHPAPLPRRPRATLDLRLPPGLRAAVPWPSGGGANRYLLDGSTFRLRGLMALGRLQETRVEVPGGRLDIAVLGGARRVDLAGIRRWIREAALSLASVFGSFPVSRARVLVTPVERGDRPVAFGISFRGGGPTVGLLLHAEATSEELRRDWIAVHEMLHLGMPWIAPKDSWLSEGIAMYDTEVLRARAGLIPGAACWRKLHEGFGRGRRSGTGRALLAESRAMYRTRAYHRVYWAGAAIAFILDVELRKRIEGPFRSLDDVLRHWQSCCLGAGRAWRAEELIAELDRVEGRPWFRSRVDRYLGRSGFPDLEATYAALGLVSQGGTVRSLGGAPERRLRRAILRATRGGRAEKKAGPAAGGNPASEGPK